MTNTLLTLRFNTQAQLDISRITRELTDLQRQVATGYKSNEIAGYGVGASRLLNARGLVEIAESRANSALQLQGRFGVQGSALGQAAGAAFNLSQAIRDAISGDDVNSLNTELTVAFSSALSAFNETWNGQPLFAGERLSGSPVKITSMAELMAAAGPQDIYNEAEREQIIDLGPGARLSMAEKASALSTDLFDQFKALQAMINTWGGTLPDTLSATERQDLQQIAQNLDRARDKLTGAEGQAGQLERRITEERTRLTARSTLLQKEVGDQAAADIGELTIQINTLLVQYEATAKTFSDISNLSLVDYLR